MVVVVRLEIVMSPEVKAVPAASPVDMLMVMLPATAPAPEPVAIVVPSAIVKTPAVLAVRLASTTPALEVLAVAVKKLRNVILAFTRMLRPASNSSPKLPVLPEASSAAVTVISLFASSLT